MIDSRIASLLVAATLTATIASTNASAQSQQIPTSFGFETRDATNRPLGWYFGGAGYEVAMDSSFAMAGKYSLRTRWIDTLPRSEQAFGVVTNSYPVVLARGRA